MQPTSKTLRLGRVACDLCGNAVTMAFSCEDCQARKGLFGEPCAQCDEPLYATPDCRGSDGCPLLTGLKRKYASIQMARPGSAVEGDVFVQTKVGERREEFCLRTNDIVGMFKQGWFTLEDTLVRVAGTQAWKTIAEFCAPPSPAPAETSATGLMTKLDGLGGVAAPAVVPPVLPKNEFEPEGETPTAPEGHFPLGPLSPVVVPPKSEPTQTVVPASNGNGGRCYRIRLPDQPESEALEVGFQNLNGLILDGQLGDGSSYLVQRKRNGNKWLRVNAVTEFTDAFKAWKAKQEEAAAVPSEPTPVPEPAVTFEPEGKTPTAPEGFLPQSNLPVVVPPKGEPTQPVVPDKGSSAPSVPPDADDHPTHKEARGTVYVYCSKGHKTAVQIPCSFCKEKGQVVPVNCFECKEALVLTLTCESCKAGKPVAINAATPAETVVAPVLAPTRDERGEPAARNGGRTYRLRHVGDLESEATVVTFPDLKENILNGALGDGSHWLVAKNGKGKWVRLDTVAELQDFFQQYLATLASAKPATPAETASTPALDERGEPATTMAVIAEKAKQERPKWPVKVRPGDEEVLQLTTPEIEERIQKGTLTREAVIRWTYPNWDKLADARFIFREAFEKREAAASAPADEDKPSCVHCERKLPSKNMANGFCPFCGELAKATPPVAQPSSTVTYKIKMSWKVSDAQAFDITGERIIDEILAGRMAKTAVVLNQAGEWEELGTHMAFAAAFRAKDAPAAPLPAPKKDWQVKVSPTSSDIRGMDHGEVRESIAMGELTVESVVQNHTGWVALPFAHPVFAKAFCERREAKARLQKEQYRRLAQKEAASPEPQLPFRRAEEGQWFIKSRFGSPEDASFTTVQVREAIRRGELTRSSLVRTGTDGWTFLGDHVGFRQEFNDLDALSAPASDAEPPPAEETPVDSGNPMEDEFCEQATQEDERGRKEAEDQFFSPEALAEFARQQEKSSKSWWKWTCPSWLRRSKKSKGEAKVEDSAVPNLPEAAASQSTPVKKRDWSWLFPVGAGVGVVLALIFLFA